VNAEFLFGTNAMIAWMESQEPLFRAIPPGLAPVVSLVTVGELEYGIAKSTRREANRARLHRVMSDFRVLTLSLRTTEIYGKLQASLRRKGRPLPTNDVWIAAQALESDLMLLTRDKHFQEVEGLSVLSW